MGIPISRFLRGLDGPFNGFGQEHPVNSIEDDAKVLKRIATALNNTESVRHQLHDVRNVVATLMLDVDCAQEPAKGLSREQAWLDAREDICDTLYALQRRLDVKTSQVERAAPISMATACLLEAIAIAQSQTPLRITPPTTDASVRVDGGVTALAGALERLANDSMRRGATQLQVSADHQRNRWCVRLVDNGQTGVIDPVVLANIKALAMNSGGFVSGRAHASVEIEISFRAPSDSSTSLKPVKAANYSPTLNGGLALKREASS